MRAGVSDGLSQQHRLQTFLLAYRSTVHATTKRLPSELFLNRPLRTKLDLLRPDVQKSVSEKQAVQVDSKRNRVREFNAGDKVF